MIWEWHNTLYLGAAHGIVGILYMMIKAAQTLPDLDKEIIKTIKSTVVYI
jgi:hypothetical protein